MHSYQRSTEYNKLSQKTRGVKTPQSFIREKNMPHIGSNKNPVRLKLNKVVKVNSSAYTGEAKKNFDNNWDAIFKKKEKKTTEEK